MAKARAERSMAEVSVAVGVVVFLLLRGFLRVEEGANGLRSP